MKKLLGSLLLPLLLISCGGGGGGSSETTYTVNGKFNASAVEGLKVCVKDGSYCTETDSYGNFTVKSTSPWPTLTFYVDNLPIGEYTLKENWEVVTPFKFSPEDPQSGDALAKVLHALGGDLTGTAQSINLTGIKVTVEPEVKSLLEAALNRQPFTLTVNSKEGSYQVKVSFDQDQPQVEVCDSEGNCAPVNYRQWLVLVYMAADNNLSDYAIDDLNEMAQVTYNPQVKVVVMADLKDQGGTVIAQSNGTTGKLEISSYPTEPNTASAYTLESFVKEYEDKYPASKVALIFWDHGEGWRSTKIAAIDETTTNDNYLFMYRIVDALKDLSEQGYRVSLIGFDECLMGMVEVFYDVGQFSDAVVASEALEPGTGWNYTTLLSSLMENPSLTPYQLGKAIVDAYREAYGTQSDKTMALLSREEIEELVNSVNGLYTRINQDTYQDFLLARENSVVVPDDQDGTLYHVDLYSFASQLKDSYPEAAKIVSVIDNAYKFSSNPQLKGISIYFPSDTKSDSSYPCYLLESPSSQIECFNDPNYYNPFAVNLWDDFLQTYYDLGE